MCERVPDEAVVSALIGLAGACNNNPKTSRTDGLVIRALAGEQGAEAIRAEKFAVAPDCAVCKNPCGNTSDYHMERLYNADAEVREAKLQILAALRETAARLLRALERQTEVDLLYKALLYVGNDVQTDDLYALLEEIRVFQRKIEEDQTI